MNPPILSVSGLKKQVRDRTIVKNVSFDVFPGEIFGFLGPNGAGKTTTIRMLVGLIRPSAGRIFINGHNLRTHPEQAMRSVGCIVENPDLYPYLTGYENLLQLGRMQGPKAVHRIDTVAALVKLSDRLHDKVGTYSLGMRQRLGIAQALLCDPKLLILDEPTNGLDPSGIRDLRGFLRSLAATGLGIFVSSHLLSEMEQLCDRVSILHDGSVVQVGSVEELLGMTSPTIDWRVTPIDTAVPILSQFAVAELVIDGGHLHCAMASSDVSRATRALIAAGCDVHEVTKHRITLEDVFMEATGGPATHGIFASRIQ